ncbi:MAG TPA: Tex-like N-terminal domain-containing protein, partial [Daejeonella sp.]|nr:Tex-like N-terminal domain-containing protein [Daejeonella sp.]
MTLNKYKKIADELSVTEKQVKVTIELLDEGGTVPFIARYRKEATGSLDEVQIAAIRDRKQQLEELDKRREAILKSMKELEKLTPELEKQIMEAETMTILEDIYLPFKPKRKTKASVAREKGLQGLADFIMNQDSTDLDTEASKYINEESGVLNIDDALSGARDILAEFMAEQPELRSRMRELFIQTGTFHSKLIKGKETEGQKYKDYFDWSEPVKTAPSHRVLALRRAEKEIILTLDIEVPEDDAIRILEDLYIKGSNLCSEQVRQAAADAFKRLIKPSMETEIRLMTKKQADTEAIRVFAE